MEFSPELLQQFINTEDWVTILIIYLAVRNKFAKHFEKIEDSLSKIGENIMDLNKSIIDLELKQTNKINNLSERVSKIEKNIKGD